MNRMDNRGPKRNTLGWPEPHVYVSQMLADDKALTKRKAKQMLLDNSAQGHPLTEKQKEYFGAVAGGNSRKRRAY